MTGPPLGHNDNRDLRSSRSARSCPPGWRLPPRANALYLGTTKRHPISNLPNRPNVPGGHADTRITNPPVRLRAVRPFERRPQVARPTAAGAPLLAPAARCRYDIETWQRAVARWTEPVPVYARPARCPSDRCGCIQPQTRGTDAAEVDPALLRRTARPPCPGHACTLRTTPCPSPMPSCPGSVRRVEIGWCSLRAARVRRSAAATPLDRQCPYAAPRLLERMYRRNAA